VKSDLENTPYHKLENFNRGELKFWGDLKEACLQPFSVAFGHTQELKGWLKFIFNPSLNKLLRYSASNVSNQVLNLANKFRQNNEICKKFKINRYYN